MSSPSLKSDICIVSSGSLSSGPRVVKEADALVAAGFSVNVIAVQTAKWMDDWDCRLSSKKGWTATPVQMFKSSPAIFAAKLFTKVIKSFGQSEASLSSSHYFLSRAAKRHPAKLYIAHNLAALPIAAQAAKHADAKFAFDAEDDHLGELSDAERDSQIGLLIRAVEGKYLRRCAYVTAASEGIAKSLATRYGISLPTPLHNVFSLSSRQSVDGLRKERGTSRLSIYWYSQTIGLNRGLQDLMIAAGSLKGSFEIHLRGSVTSEVKSELLACVPNVEAREKIFFHEQVHPDELLSRTAEHDVGMALEQPVSQNKMSTVSNKLFFYFLGGLAVVATDTPGQSGIVKKAEHCGEIYPAGNTQKLARILQQLHDDEAALKVAKEGSRRAADTLWNWETESSILLALVRKTLAQR